MSLFYRWANRGPNTLHLVPVLNLGLCDSQTALYPTCPASGETWREDAYDKSDPSRGILGPEGRQGALS